MRRGGSHELGVLGCVFWGVEGSGCPDVNFPNCGNRKSHGEILSKSTGNSWWLHLVTVATIFGFGGVFQGHHEVFTIIKRAFIWVFPKKGYPKMDGENNGKPY